MVKVIFGSVTFMEIKDRYWNRIGSLMPLPSSYVPGMVWYDMLSSLRYGLLLVLP